MRTITRTVLGLAIILGSTSLTSCKGKQKETAQAPKGDVEVKVECSGPEYFSTKKAFRANSMGESLDQVTAKKKALSNARADLASQISTTIKGTIDNYVNSREFNNKEQVEERFEGLTREVINQKLSGTKTICEKTFQNAETNKYKTYVAIELDADELVEAINERLSKNEALRIDYDYEKFKETFEKEMEKLEKGY